MTEQEKGEHLCRITGVIICYEENNQLKIGTEIARSSNKYLSGDCVNFCPMCGYKIPENPKPKTIDQIDLKSALNIIESTKTLALKQIRNKCINEIEIANTIYEKIIEEFENQSVTNPNQLEKKYGST